ncbi:MAG: hypothetical protein ACE5GC_10440, partial [Acidimicrobiia bacterium]
MAGLRRSLAPGIAALALIAAACAGVDATILATVDGAEITVDDLRVMRPAYEGEFETNTERVRTDLTVLIISEAVLASAADLGVEITEAEIDQRIADPPPRYADALATTAADVELTEVVLRRDARMSLLRDKVSAELMRAEDGFLEGIIDEAPQEVAVGCIRHILVDTEQEALAALDRLGAGEDFAALADELSTDTVSIGGLLANASTCMLPMGRWVPEFASVAAVALDLARYVGMAEHRDLEPVARSQPIGVEPLRRGAVLGAGDAARGRCAR